MQGEDLDAHVVKVREEERRERPRRGPIVYMLNNEESVVEFRRVFKCCLISGGSFLRALTWGEKEGLLLPSMANHF